MTDNRDSIAFPIIQGREEIIKALGLTKRELFAAMAMQGILSGLYTRMDFVDDGDGVIRSSIIYADALILKLQNKG